MAWVSKLIVVLVFLIYVSIEGLAWCQPPPPQPNVLAALEGAIVELQERAAATAQLHEWMQHIVDRSLAHVEPEGPEGEEAVSLMLKLAHVFEGASEFKRAIQNFDRSLRANAEMTARGCDGLASCLFAVGRPQEARPAVVRALAIRVARYGKDDPDTQSALDNVLTLCKRLGLKKQAVILRKIYEGEEPSEGSPATHAAVDLQETAIPPVPSNRPTFRWGKP